MRQLVRRTIGCVAILSAAASCGKRDDRAGSADGDTGSISLSADDQAATKKLQPIVACWNEPVGGLVADGDQYRKEFRPLIGSASASPVTMQIFNAASLFQGSTTSANADGALSRACADKLDAAVRSGPPIAGVDDATPKVADALRRLVGPAKAFDEYIQQKGYLDDHWAKARALDAQLMPILAQLTAAGKRMYDGMRAEKAVLDQHLLAEIEKRDGHSMGWHEQKMRIAARVLTEQVDALVKNGKLDTRAMDKVIAPLQADYDAAQAYATAHPEVAKSAPGKRSPLWPTLGPVISDELAKARDLRRTLANPDADAASQAHSVSRDVGTLVEAYNAVVFAFNWNQG